MGGKLAMMPAISVRTGPSWSPATTTRWEGSAMPKASLVSLAAVCVPKWPGRGGYGATGGTLGPSVPVPPRT